MKVIRWHWSILSNPDRLKLISLLASRVTLTGLDLLGLILVSESIKMVTGESKSMYRGILGKFIFTSLVNPYAFTALVAVFFFIAKTLLSVYLVKLSVLFGASVETKFTSKLYENQIFNKSRHGQLSNTEILHLLNRSSHAAFAQIPILALTIGSEGSLVVAIGVYLLILNPILFMGSLLFLGLVAWFMHIFVNLKTQDANKKSIEASLLAQQVVLDSITSLKTISVFGKSATFTKLFTKFHATQAHEMGRVVLFGYLPRFITELAIIFGLGIFLFQRAFFASTALLPSTLAVFLAAAFRILSSMLPLQNAFSSLKLVAVDGQFAIAEFSKLQKNDSKEITHVKSIRPDIEFKDVAFRYSNTDQPVFEGATFKIAFGDFMQISGPSGSGKSTLVDLILGLEIPTLGKITYLNSRDGEMVDPKSIKIGFVPQSNALFHGTFLDNLTLFAKPDEVDLDKLAFVLQKCSLTDFVSSLPDGLDTVFGSTDAKISGGQMQRVALARALLAEPEILVLDESTNALDRETENEISNFLQTLRGFVTIIVITHGKKLGKSPDVELSISSGKVIPIYRK